MAAWHIGDEAGSEVHFARFEVAAGRWSVWIDRSGADQTTAPAAGRLHHAVLLM